MRKLIRGSILVLLFVCLETPLVVGATELINTLTVTKGPGVGEISLSWGGDFSPYAIYRSGTAPAVVAPANLQAYTSSNTYIDPTPIANILFFNVIGACTSSTDTPDLAFADSNCDGIDGNPLEAIFVDNVTGNDGNSGAINAPKKTIGSGIAAAAATIPKKSVYISKGIYPEALALSSGVSLYGGYDAAAAWTRSNGNTTTIASPTTTGLTGSSLTGPVEVQLFTITSQNAVGTNGAGSGNSSYGVFIRLSSSVALQGLTIMPGSGSSAASVSGGLPGASGGNGGNASGPNRGSRGTSSCGASGGFGGQGVGGPGTGAPGEPGTQAPGGGASGSGGTGGNTGSSCGLAPSDGGPGTPASSNGLNGSLGANGAVSAGLGTFSTSYAPPIGNNGGLGTQGGGGGGGASGGGASVQSGTLCFTCLNLASGGGGGGGAGGCGGSGGQGGRGGGGSFGVVSVASTVSITSCQITTKNGGGGSAGGNGGAGGVGGFPGSGTLGQSQSGGCGTLSAGAGGNGSRGGNGENGGSGSGGAGGPTTCIAYNGALPTQSGNTCTLGTFGSGGVGGFNGISFAPNGPFGAAAVTLNFP